MSAFAPLDPAVNFVYPLLSSLSVAIGPLGGAAAAIVVATLGLRLLLAPLGYLQRRGQRAQAALAPRVLRLRDKYRDQPARLQAETLALYRAEGVSPFSGCLPALIQAPLFAVTYRLFTAPEIGHQPNALLGQRPFGVPLGQSWLGAVHGGLLSAPSLVFLGLFAVLALLAWWSGRRAQHPAGGRSPLLRLLPFGTVLFATAVPLAAGLYLLTSAAYTAVENRIVFTAPKKAAPGEGTPGEGTPGKATPARPGG